MPIVIALAIRALIQMAVTLGVISLAERFVLPLLNKGIAELIQLFGVSEEEAQDIVANELLIFAETVGVGALALRTKLPLKVADRLGFTSKGFGRRKLSPKAATAAGAPRPTAPVTLSSVPVPSASEAAFIVNTARTRLSGFAVAYDLVLKTLAIPFLALIGINNLIDFGNWNSGAYQKTFQRIFAKITGGLLVPDEDYRKTRTASPEVFNKVFATYQIEGATAINDPFKMQSVPFTRDNLIDLVDQVGAELLRTTQRASTKDVLLATQLMIVFKKPTRPAPQGPAPIARAAVSPVKVFTGVVAQGALGVAEPFTPREDDLISNVEELRVAAQNNLAAWQVGLPGRIIHELKIVTSVTNKDGTRRVGSTQQVIRGYKKDGSPVYKTITNKFAVIDLFIFTARNVRSKIDTIILGPVDAATLQISPEALAKLARDIKADTLTNDTADITAIQTPNPISIMPPASVFAPLAAPAVEETEIARKFRTLGLREFGLDKLPEMETRAADPGTTRETILAPLGVAGADPRYEELVRKELEVKLASIRTLRAAGIAQSYPNLARRLNIPELAEALPDQCGAQTLSTFYQAAGQTLPTIAARSMLYEQFGLGPAAWYTGTAEQNIKLLAELKRKAGCI